MTSTSAPLLPLAEDYVPAPESLLWKGYVESIHQYLEVFTAAAGFNSVTVYVRVTVSEEDIAVLAAFYSIDDSEITIEAITSKRYIHKLGVLYTMSAVREATKELQEHKSYGELIH